MKNSTLEKLKSIEDKLDLLSQRITILEEIVRYNEKTAHPSTINPPFQPNQNDYCTNCPSNPANNPLGITVGDSPCQWCLHNKFKITFSTDTHLS